MGSNSDMIVNGCDFDVNKDVSFKKITVNKSGGKNVGISSKGGKQLFISTPLLLTWGVNENDFDGSGKYSYDMSLQFPRDGEGSESSDNFLKNLIKFEEKIKELAVENSKEWFNKSKMSSDVIDALWTPILKYPKNPSTGEADMSRSPTLRLKLDYWESNFKCEIYDMNSNLIFPQESSDVLPKDLIVKGCNVAVIMRCGGIWFANGKFGCTWRLEQAVVKPRASLKGRCHIVLEEGEKKILESQKDDQEESVTLADDSDEDDGDNATMQTTTTEVEADPPTVKEEVKEAIESSVETVPAKKKVVRKKKAVETQS